MQAIVIWMFLATVAVAPTMARATAEAACGVDRYEPNDERGRAKSTRGKRVEARVCGDDTDWYYVKLDAGETVTVATKHAPGAPVEVMVFPPRSRKPRGALTTRGDTREVKLRVTEPGKHRVRVRAIGGAASAYTLEVIRGR